MQSPDGDIIDCVDIYKQPALDHPALKNHSIQMRPSYIPVPDSIKSQNHSSSRSIPLQVWQRSGSCPKGTIPIRRVSKQDLLRFYDIERFGRKNPQFVNTSESYNRQGHGDRTVVINDGTVSLGPQVNLSSAMLVATVYHFVGSRASLNVWNPRVASPDEYTTSQIWLLGGGRDDYESVEAGWMVNPKLYGDKQTRLFAYWTSDASKTTGCFDLLCSGFVQTSTKVALGAAITPVSSVFGPQYEIRVSIYMDKKTDNWWLRINDNTDLGYWPSSLFSDYLKSSATLAQWGGEVYSPDVRKSPHTTTAMGSGSFAEDLFDVASYVAHIRVMDFSFTWKYPQYVGTYADEWNCYSAYHYVPGYMTEPVLFFGGPGQNPRCS